MYNIYIYTVDIYGYITIYHLHSFATSSGRTAAWRALSAALPGSTCRRQPKKGEVQRERRIGLEPLNYHCLLTGA